MAVLRASHTTHTLGAWAKAEECCSTDLQRKYVACPHCPSATRVVPRLLVQLLALKNVSRADRQRHELRYLRSPAQNRPTSPPFAMPASVTGPNPNDTRAASLGVRSKANRRKPVLLF